MKDALFWWTGATMWAGVGVALAWLAIEFLIGFACAVSWCRWSYRMMKAHGRTPKWRNLPRTFLSRWSDLASHRNNGDTIWTGTNGYWRGIGDWGVTPPNGEVRGESVTAKPACEASSAEGATSTAVLGHKETNDGN